MTSEGKDEAKEDPDLRGAVDPSRLQQVLRDPDEEVAQEEDREWEPERGVEENDGEDRVVDPERLVEPEHGDERHLERHDEECDDDDEYPVTSGEVEPGERIAGERSHDYREQRPADRDPHRRHERRRDRLVVKDRGV